MSTGVRLITATAQHELVTCVRTAFGRKPYIESIISVTRPKEAENKLDRKSINVLLWDLNFERHDISWVNLIRNSYDLHIIYTSFDSTPAAILTQNSKDTFISKPAIFTTLTTNRYAEAIDKAVENITRQQRPIPMRDMAKMVSINDKQKIVVIASSTGGTNALEDIIRQLPVNSPPIVIVQHMPGGFTKLFAERLDGLYKQEVKEAESGDFLMRGRILLAPADQHIKLVKRQGKVAVECFVGTRIHGVMPAADILFDSVVDVVKSNAVGVVLTGMGNDGAKGLMHMRNIGCKNIGQNEATCVVYGMPKAAIDMGAIDFELPLFKIADKIMELAR